jgi:hypothetical protein
MQRRRYLALAGASMTVLAGCSGDEGGGDNGSDGTDAPTETAQADTETEAETGMQTDTEMSTEAGGMETTMDAEDTMTATPGEEGGDDSASVSSSVEPQSFEGSSPTATDTFSLTGDAAVFAIEYSGESGFSVELLDESGEVVEVLVSTINDYQGRIVLGPPEGEYSLDINADDDWTATIEPPESETVSLPQDAEGTGSDFIGPVSFEGSTTLTFEGTDEDYYGVLLRDAAGQDVEVLVNEYGPTDELSTSFSADAIGFVQVETLSSWTATLESA